MSSVNIMIFNCGIYIYLLFCEDELLSEIYANYQM